MSKGSGFEIEFSQEGDPSVLEASDGNISINIPIEVKYRSGKHLITLPDGTKQTPRPWDTELTPLQMALARGHRWNRLLESGECKSMREIAEREGLDNSYVSRMINLTLLAPDIVEAILDDTLPPNVSLFDLAVDPPRLWRDQRKKFAKKKA